MVDVHRGLFGAVYLAVSVAATPELGFSLFYVLFVCGTLVSSMALDHIGCLDFPVRRVTPMKILGVAFAMAGVVLMEGVNSHGWDSPTDLGYSLAAFITGLLMPVQTVVNKVLARNVGTPLRATAMSMFGVCLTLVAVAAIEVAWQSLEFCAVHNAWWVWTGGLLGNCYVLAGCIFPSKIGIAWYFVLLVLGQLITSVVFDSMGIFARRFDAAEPLEALDILGVFFVLGGALMMNLHPEKKKDYKYSEPKIIT